MITSEAIEAVLRARERAGELELARRGLLPFIQGTFPGGYQTNWHHELICKEIEEWLWAEEPFNLMLSMPPRHGKALEINTPIPTPDGWQRIIDLNVGDKVFDEQGNIVDVIAKSQVFENREAFKVTTDDGDAIICDAEHEWHVRLCRKRRVFRTRTTEYLAKRTCDRKPMIQAQRPLKTPDANLPIEPYVLGVWLGDGCSQHATITQGQQDIQYIREQVEGGGYKTSDRATPCTFGVLGLNVQLRELGLLGNKHIPKSYLRGSPKQRLALLQGLVDTDGFVAPDGQVEFCTIKKGLAIQAKELVSSLGHKASIIPGEAKLNGKCCGPKYRVMFYMADAARLPRKAIKCKTGLRAFRRFITVQKHKNADTVCIQVNSASHLYLCGRSMIPTHNSEICSRHLPAYILGRNPDAQVIAASYSGDLISAMSRDCQRIMISPEYRKIFPETQLTTRGNRQDETAIRRAEEFSVMHHKGHYRAAGIGGGLTGRGGHCLTAETLIHTNKGQVKIKNIKINDMVLSLGEGLCYNKVIAKRKLKAKILYEITSGSNIITATGEHPIFVFGKGYTQAKDLQIGDKTLTLKQELLKLRGGDNRTGITLSEMLPSKKKRRRGSYLRLVRETCCQKSIRCEKSKKAWAQSIVLFLKMFTKSSCCKEFKKMPHLWRHSKKRQKILFSQVRPTSEEIKTYLLQILCPTIRAFKSFDRILFSGLQKQFSFAENIRKEQSKLQTRFRNGRLSEGILPNKAKGNRAGRRKMCYLRSSQENCSSSQRLQSTKQQNEQLNDAVPSLPCDTPQIKQDTISSITIKERHVAVYDIQVESAHNFFANRILVHNCGIIDDPIKDRKDAESETIRKNCIEWYTSVFRTRMEKGGRILLLMTRWHTDDLAGWAIKKMKDDPEADRWKVIVFPGIFEKTEYTHPQDPRKKGEALWPDKAGVKELGKIRATLTKYEWAGLYQQRPTPSGGAVIKREWLKVIEPEKVPAGLYWVRYWDLAVSKKTSADYTASGKMALDQDMNIYVRSFIQDRMEWPETRRAIINIGKVERIPVGIETCGTQQGFFQDLLATATASQIPLVAYNEDTDKLTRALPWVARCEAGKFFIVRGKGVDNYIDELVEFTGQGDTHDDQVDWTSGAYRMLSEYVEPKLTVLGEYA